MGRQESGALSAARGGEAEPAFKIEVIYDDRQAAVCDRHYRR